MNISIQGNTTILKDTQANINSFLDKITEDYQTYKDVNLILDLSENQDLKNKDVLLFSKLSSAHKKSKKSFVLILEFDFNTATDKVMVVPTLQEALDIIEMEEIERDLGF
jgi:hypothetical protein